MNRRFVIAVVMAAAALPMAGATPAAATGADLFPDMRMAPIYGLELRTGPRGHKLVRFGTVVYNVGDGPMEIHGRQRDHDRMTKVTQWIQRDDGSAYSISKPNMKVFYAGDGHDHWHVARLNSVEITPLTPTPTTDTRRLRKIGFCLVDSTKIPDPRPPNSTDTQTFYTCGDRTSTSIRIGIDVGWGDIYTPDIRFQAIDVTGLPAGDYKLCAKVNPQGIWKEKDDNYSNNAFWITFHLDPANDELSNPSSGANTAC